MAVKQIEIPDIGTVTLYKRRGNRSLRLSVSSAGEIRISMPYWLPYKVGERFALTKAAWIVAHRGTASTGLKHGQAIGKAHRLELLPMPEATKVTTRIQQNAVEVKHPPHYTADHPEVQKAARSASVRALRQEAEQLLPIRLRDLAAQRGFAYSSVSIRRLKGRWGSCSAKREITLNLFLMQLPWHLIDYVLLHELTHTKVMRHGAPFWEELERHAPTAKLLRKEINTHRPLLTAEA